MMPPTQMLSSFRLHILSLLIVVTALHSSGLEVVAAAAATTESGSGECVARHLGEENIVCVCNATYCDQIGAVQRLAPGSVWQYSSDISGQRFVKQNKKFAQTDSVDGGWTTTTTTTDGDDGGASAVTLNRAEVRQSILGFGGAFTDAAGINIVSLSAGAQDNLLRSYFAAEGIEYTLGRVPIGGCDFSPRLYTYDDVTQDDFNLTHFRLADEDLHYKIPLVQRALGMSARGIRLFASPWSSPAWMKTNGQLIGQGWLKGEPGGSYYQAWADYFVRFLDEYARRNVSFWAVTAQNEPTNGRVLDFGFNCLGFTAQTQATFIGQNLGPTLARRGYSLVKILMLDDQRLMLPAWAKQVLADEDARRYVSGVAFHWYLNAFVPPGVLERTHQLFPDTFLLASEACEGSQPWERPVLAGSWLRAQNYASDIIQDLLHWTVGWVDWNLALNTSGGPNWTGAGDDSPVLVDASKDEFYKQPMYYALGHFSKFVPPGCVVISLNETTQDPEIEKIAFYNSADDSTILVVLNKWDHAKTFTFFDPEFGSIGQQLPRRSIHTFIWWST